MWVAKNPFRYCCYFTLRILGKNHPIYPKARTWTLPVNSLLALWRKDEAQDIAEYAVMLAVVLVLIIATDSAHRLELQQCVLKRFEFASIEALEGGRVD